MSIAPLTVGRIMAPGNTGTTGTGSTNTTSGSDTGARSTAGTTELGREAFLQLLVAQLKYQDPSKPMDASQMIAQSAQLSMVDKLNEISTALSAQAVTQQLTLAGSVIGKEITFSSEEGVKITAVVNSVRFANGELVLSTPDWDVPMGSVEAIGRGAAETAADAAASGQAGTQPQTTTPPATTPPATTPPATTPPATDTTTALDDDAESSGGTDATTPTEAPGP